MAEGDMAHGTIRTQPQVSEAGGEVLVFHGTTLRRIDAILWEGTVRADANPIWPTTSPGFVYVPLSLQDALEFGRLALLKERGGSRRTGGGGALLAAVLAWPAAPEGLLADRDEHALDDEWDRDGRSRGRDCRRIPGAVQPRRLWLAVFNAGAGKRMRAAGVQDLQWLRADEPLVELAW